MSHEPVIRRMFDEVINQGKLDVVDALFDEDFRTETPQGAFDREGFKGYVTMWRGGFPDVHCEVSDVIEAGDQIAWRVRATGTHTGDFAGAAPTGKPVDFDSLNQATMRNGRGWRHIVVIDTLGVLSQLGAVPKTA